MEKKFRIEYMYPNIEDKEKFIRMKNAFSFMNKADLYEQFLRDKEKEIFDSIDIKINSNRLKTEQTTDNIKKACKILTLYPEYVPEYLTKNSLYIMEKLVGECRSYIFDERSREFWNYIGKRQLSIFLLVIEELIKNGINCDELLINHECFLIGGNSFKSLDNISYYGTNTAYECRYNSYITDIKGRTYDNYFEYMNFYDLQTFLDNIIKLAERESYIDEEISKIPNPRLLNFNKYLYTDNPKIIKDIVGEYGSIIENFDKSSTGEFVDVIEYCKKLKEKLNNSRIEAERKVTARYVDEILEKITNCDDDLEKENYINKIKDILKDCDPVIKEEMLDRIQEKMGFKTYTKPEFITDSVNLFNTNQLNEGNIEIGTTYIDDRINNLEKDLLKLKENYREFDESLVDINGELKEIKDLIKEQNKLIEELENKLYNYFENGGKLPLENMKSVPKQKLKQMIKEYRPKSLSGSLRKYLAIISLSMIVNTGLNVYDHISNINNEDTVNIEQSDDEKDSSDKKENEEEKQKNKDTKNEDNISETTNEDTVNIQKSDDEKDSSDKKENEEEKNKDKVKEIKNEDNITRAISYIDDLRIGKPISSGNKNYYCSIYDEFSSGITSKGGKIIAYYPMIEENGNLINLGAIRNNKEALEFLLTYNQDDLAQFKWKVAVASGEFYEVEEAIKNNVDTDSKYTTFFLDYDIDVNGEKIKRMVK